MNTNETSEVFDPANAPTVDLEQSKSVGIGKIAGKEITITGYKQTRGKPSAYTNKEDIGEDGKTDYFTIRTKESFDLPPKKDEPAEPINNFFVPKGIMKQIKTLEGISGQPVGERSIGPVKPVLRPSTKTAGHDFWALAYKNEPDYA